MTPPIDSLLKDLRVALKRVGALREAQVVDKASGDKASGNQPCGDKTP